MYFFVENMDGPHLVVIIFMKGSKYACKERNDWDQICSLCCSQKGLNMRAI